MKKQENREKCEICKIDYAIYQCARCGRLICNDCFRLKTGLCDECYKQESNKDHLYGD